jgi:hypothetical protein
MSASNPSFARPGVVRTPRPVRSSEHGTAEPLPIEAIEHTIRHTALRGLGFGGLLGIALIHLLDVISKMNETPYVGVMYIVLMGASISLAFLILHRGSRLAWTAAGLLAAMTLIGFVLSRTTGLPNANGDIGNWSEPLGLASLLVEGAFVVLSAYALWLGRRETTPGLHQSVPVDPQTSA